MTKNDLMSLLESNSPFDYHILTPLVSFILLCISVETDLIHSLGTLTLTNIDHVNILAYMGIEHPHRKEVESPAKVTQNMLAYMRIEPRQIPILAV